MIISKEEYEALDASHYSIEGTAIHHGNRYLIITRYDEQRTDHVLADGIYED